LGHSLVAKGPVEGVESDLPDLRLNWL